MLGKTERLRLNGPDPQPMEAAKGLDGLRCSACFKRGEREISQTYLTPLRGLPA